MIENRMKELRARESLTQEELARLASISRQAVLSIENKKYIPSLELAFRIASALNEPIQNVFFVVQDQETA